MNSTISINEYTNTCQIHQPGLKTEFAVAGLRGTTRILLLIIFLSGVATAGLSAQTASLYDQGVQAFMDNKPQDAAAMFETALTQGNTDADTYLYLAYSYEQLGMFDQGITTLQRGLGFARDKRYLFYYNMGNLYIKKDDLDSAIQQFNMAITSRGTFQDAYLNRANCYLRNWDLASALQDYQSFVSLAPDHSLTPDVKRMIAAIQKEVSAEEARKIEEAKQAELAAEQQRQAELLAQQQAAEEEARRQALLDDVLGNLNSATDETQTVGAGTEGISDQEDDYQRAD